MKKSIKNYVKLGLLLIGVSLTLTNCDKDDGLNNYSETAIENKSKFIVKVINAENVKSNKKLYSKIDRVKKLQKSNTSKVIN